MVQARRVWLATIQAELYNVHGTGKYVFTPADFIRGPRGPDYDGLSADQWLEVAANKLGAKGSW